MRPEEVARGQDQGLRNDAGPSRLPTTEPRATTPPPSLQQLLPPPNPSSQSPWWGLPDDPGEASEHLVDPLLKAKLAHFHDLKSRDPPTHFNESLLSNRSFRNPHIYDKLVAFVGIDERAWGRERHPRAGEAGGGERTAGGSRAWEEEDINPQGDLPERLAEEQRRYTEERQAQQKLRSRIDFASSRHPDTGPSSSSSTPDARVGCSQRAAAGSSSSSNNVASAVERARQAARRVEQIRNGAGSSRPSSSSSSSDSHKRHRK